MNSLDYDHKQKIVQSVPPKEGLLVSILQEMRKLKYENMYAMYDIYMLYYICDIALNEANLFYVEFQQVKNISECEGLGVEIQD